MTKNIVVFWNEIPSLVWVTTFQRNLFPKFPKIQKRFVAALPKMMRLRRC